MILPPPGSLHRNATVASYTAILGSVLNFTLSPVIGRLSDSIGRRKCIAAAMCPMVLRQIFLFLWAVTDGGFSLYPYFVMQGVLSNCN